MSQGELHDVQTAGGAVNQSSHVKLIGPVAVGLILLTVGVLFAYRLGHAQGAQGKKAGFDQLPAPISLDGTKWSVTFNDLEQGELLTGTATAEFKQYGSRLIGESRAPDGASWIFEGVIADRRIIYNYLDNDHSRLIFGVGMLEIQEGENQIVGQWMGFSPNPVPPPPQKITFTRIGD